jgi:hypothetical protein
MHVPVSHVQAYVIDRYQAAKGFSEVLRAQNGF